MANEPKQTGGRKETPMWLSSLLVDIGQLVDVLVILIFYIALVAATVIGIMIAVKFIYAIL